MIYKNHSHRVYQNFQNKEDRKDEEHFIDSYNKEVKESNFCKGLESHKDSNMYDHYFKGQQSMITHYEKELRTFYQYLSKN